jgi:phosphoribosyl 1,2-cyclic phosphodiesterase
MTTSKYKLRIWGARGTGPTPAADRLAFGGNTSCAAVDLGQGSQIVLDCGSGLGSLGSALVAQGNAPPGRFHIFISHYHFDHIEGLPRFHPLYDPKSEITIHGADADGRSVREILESYMCPPYFPVSLASVPSRLDYRRVDSSDPQTIADVTVRSLPVNHPDGCQSYRLDHGKRSIVYATDHEHGDEPIDRALLEFARGTDYLIYDATYQPAEYEELRRGWGHSTWYAAVQLAVAAEVGTLVLFHHHPEHSDDDLRRVLEITRREFSATEIAWEGLELEF